MPMPNQRNGAVDSIFLPSRATGYSVHLTKNPDEEKERRKGMDNERNSGSNPKTQETRERKEADKANGLDRKFSCIKLLKHITE